jgi:hypothetical protein
MEIRSTAVVPALAHPDGRVGSSLREPLAFGIVAGAASGQERSADRRSLIEEVIVTAEQREESEMTVPLAITAFDAVKIENVNDLALMTPGLEVSTHAHNNSFTMRGVGTTFSSAHLSESSVATPGRRCSCWSTTRSCRAGGIGARKSATGSRRTAAP